MQLPALATVFAAAGCSSPASPPLDARPSTRAITATLNSTRFVTREHMLAAAEMQISGEPFAEAMGRDLGNYSRDHVPTDIYFDSSPLSGGPWIDLPGYSTAVESYEYSKQPMNLLGFESGAGTPLAYGPLVNPTNQTGAAATALMSALVAHYARASNATGRFVFAPGTYPRSNASGNINPTGAGDAANNPLGWPGLWPTNHVFVSFDPAIDPTGDIALSCAITSDDDPGATGALGCADYECDASSLHLRSRLQIDPTITPGADGFSAWKYGLWVLNYLQVMHDSTEAGVATDSASDLTAVGTAGNQVVGDDGDGNATAAGTFLGSSDIEGFQAQLFIASMDNRAADWLLHFATAGNAAQQGFATISAALAYDYTTPLRWFPGRVHVTEASDGSSIFPIPAYSIDSPNSDLLDLVGLALGYSELYALTDTANADVGGAQPAIAYFDGDPFPSDNQLADGQDTPHDRALAMLRVALVNLDRLHIDPVTGILVDSVTMAGPMGTTPTRGTTLSTISLAYTLLGLRTTLRSLSSQLELYSNNVPDTATGTTPLDALPIHFAADGSLTFTGRVRQLLLAHAALLYDHLTDAEGRAFDGWNVATNAPIDNDDALDAHTAAIRGLFAAYLATGDIKYHDRALLVFERLEGTFYDPTARMYNATPGVVTDVEYTPLRFALLQSALRDMYELVATRPGGEALEADLESRVARVNKLLLNGWDDRDGNRLVDWPGECVNADGGLPHGGLQMAERTLTGEIGSLQETLMPGIDRTATSDREHDCVPEIDDAHLPAALADSVTFHAGAN